MAKTWQQKFHNGKEPIVKKLDIAYGGMKAGDNMLISSPQEISDYIMHVPKGSTKTIEEMRKDLAKQHSADGTCPLTTGIFTRIVAEKALEEMQSGAKDITPFWRVVDPKSTLAQKISAGPDFIVAQRKSEA